MVDFMSRYRMYGYGYNSQTPRRPITTSYRDLYRLQEPLLFRTPRVLVHDCRNATMKDLTDQFTWEAYLLSSGVRQTNNSVTSLHTKLREETHDGIKKPEKLLFDVGERGAGPGDLNYPRGMTVNKKNADVIVADTMNHRIQIFNQFGVLKYKFGGKGVAEGLFNEPTGVALAPDHRLVIADKKNQRIQVMSTHGRYKFGFPTIGQPFSVAVDSDFNIVVATMAHTIEIYTYAGKLLKCFEICSAPNKTPVYIATNDKREIIMSDTKDHTVKVFNYDGQMLYRFEPASTGKSLSCHSAGIWLMDTGDLVIADNLNHTVNLYTGKGRLIKQIAGPTDDIGAAQSVAVGPEGHLITAEFTTNGRHCIKILRFLDCDCHKTRPGSSKRRSRPSSRATSSSMTSF